AHVGRVNAVAFSPDGRLILTGGQDRQACLWSAASLRLLGAPIAHPESVQGVHFLPDGTRFVTVCYDRNTRLFDLPAPIEGEQARVQAWIETITGQQLDADGSLRVLNADEWQARREQVGGENLRAGREEANP